MADQGENYSSGEDDGLVVESLGDVNGAQPARGSMARRVGEEAARALWGRRLSGRERLGRAALVTALIAVTLFALLGGPALTMASWQRLTFALRSGTLAPRLTMSGWRQVKPPPEAPANALTYAVDPSSPNTLLACHASATGVEFWRTDTLGQSWGSVWVSQVPAQSCEVKVALDASGRLLLVARSADPRAPSCQRVALYLSAAGGDAWGSVDLPATMDATACQGDAWASARWVFAWWTDGAQPEPATSLMRSSDFGLTWQSADGGLPARDAYFAPAMTGYGSGGALLAQVYYWPRHGRLNILRQVVRSLDEGATWSTLSSGPPGAELAASLEPRVVGAGAWSTVYAPIYTDAQLSPLWTPDEPPEGIQALTARTGAWRELPPLPVNGAAAVDHRMGVAMALGVAPANVLLTLGADPHTRVSSAASGLVYGSDLWLWAWDPVAGEWRLGPQAPPNTQVVGYSWSAGPVGSAYEQTYGAYLWLTSESGGHLAVYNAFIPVPAGG